MKTPITTILSINLANVLDYVVIPGAFVIFIFAMYKLYNDPGRIKKALEEDDKEEGLK